MASSKAADQSQATKNKDSDKDKPVANGVRKDETEELVDAPNAKETRRLTMAERGGPKLEE